MQPNSSRESVHRRRVTRLVDSRLRHLDVDDLYLLALLGDGKRLADAARSLSLSQPAITQRIHKMEYALGINILERAGRGTRLTEVGLEACLKSGAALEQLEHFFSSGFPQRTAAAATGPWSAWLLAVALGKVSDPDLRLDVEYISLDALARGSQVLEGFGPIAATLHQRQVSQPMQSPKIPGYTVVRTIRKELCFWVESTVELSVDTPRPLIEVSRDFLLISDETREEIEQGIPGLRSVRFAGTVAGAIELAARGQGVLVAPKSIERIHPGLVLIAHRIVGNLTVTFDLLVDDGAPIEGVVTEIANSIESI